MDLTIRRSRNKHQISGNFFLYSMTVLTCSLFCSSPFWFPSLICHMKILIFVSLPKITSVCLSPKSLFILGNLIVIALIWESKFLASSYLPTCDENIGQKRSSSKISSNNFEGKSGDKTENSKACDLDGRRKIEGKGRGEGNLKLEEKEDFHEEDELGLPAEELNKRADDFIARVNRQRMLEARLMLCYSN
uniref:Uncharacterized protein LOC8269195 n=1 Tax=Rhizophora mucronata TaxID=61149 RepID=A0A2P2IJX2_RHIMU